MAASFPTTLKDFTDITCPSTVEPKDRINEIQDEIEALEAKVGVTSSAVTSTHDYKLSGVAAGDKAVSLTGTETLTNKRLTSPKINEDVALTATATELNYIDGATPGTAVASVAVVLDSNKDFNFGTGDITATNVTVAGDLTVADAQDIKFTSGAKIERSSGDLVLTPESNKLVKIAILRQLDTTNSYINTAAYLCGSGVITQTATTTLTETVTFGLTFASTNPDVVVGCYGGDYAANTLPPNANRGKICTAMADNVTTTTFRVLMDATTNFTNAQYAKYSWIAGGQLA